MKTHTTKQFLLFIALFLVIFGALLGLRAWQMHRVEKAMENPDLPYGLLLEPIRYAGESYLVPPSHLHESIGINAITDPKFVDIYEADTYLADDVEGVMVTVDGQTLFYSYQILNWHEVVRSDTVTVTHCALCRSSAVYESALEGDELELAPAGLVYNNNQLLASKDGSLFLQLRGTGISGKHLGKQLTEYPFDIVTWSAFKNNYQNGLALSTQTGFVRDYGSHPYQNYDQAKIAYHVLEQKTSFMDSKWQIEGLEIGDDAIAFADKIMLGKMVANETVGDIPVSGFWNELQGRTLVYLSEVDNTILTFDFNWDTRTMTDEQTGSIWNSAGQAIEGPLTGTQLQTVQTKPSFWMCWYAQYPHSRIAHIETQPIEEEENKEETELELNDDLEDTALEAQDHE